MLTVSLFGGVRAVLTRQDAPQPVPVRLTRAAQALLAYVLLGRGRAHPRATLVGVFWPECDEHRANRSLSNVLWQLRAQLERPGADGKYLSATRSDIAAAATSTLQLDVATFETALQRTLRTSADCLAPDDVDALETALDLRHAPLLDGWYEEWALNERARMDALYVRGLTHLMRYYNHVGAIDEGIACGERLVCHDPLDERVHRELMRLFLAAGRRSQAARQYELCCTILRHELDDTPSQETRAVALDIGRIALSSSPNGQHGNGQHGNGQPVRELIREIDQTIKALTSLRQRLTEPHSMARSAGVRRRPRRRVVVTGAPDHEQLDLLSRIPDTVENRVAP